MAEIKESYDRRRQVLGDIYPLDTPFTVIIDASEACNFKCKYCFRSTEPQRETWGDYAIDRKNMPLELFQEAVNQVLQFPNEVKQISLSCHGEPLCNRNIPDMVRYIKQQGYAGRVAIHTNASLLDRDYALDLADSKIDKIVISLQGLTSEDYDSVCGTKIDYPLFYDNLQILYLNKHPNTKISIKIMDVAVGNREAEFYKLFQNIADNVFVEKMVPIWKNTGNDAHPDAMKNKYGMEFSYQECCPLIFNTMVVTPDGDIYPCTQVLSKECLGNIKEISLIEAWNGEMRKELLRRQLNLNPPESCNGCYIKQNSIFTKEDMIDEYRNEILARL